MRIGVLFLLLSSSLCVAQFSTEGAPQTDENECTFCDVLVTMWQQNEANGTSSQEKTNVANATFCGALPPPLDSHCSKFVKERGAGMLKLLESGWDGNHVCTRFGKCSGSYRHAMPPNGTIQNDHMDENDMPNAKDLGRPELVPRDTSSETNQHEEEVPKRHIGNEIGEEDNSFLEVGTMGIGQEVSRAINDGRWLWKIVFTNALKWHEKDSYKHAKATSASLLAQLDPSVADPQHHPQADKVMAFLKNPDSAPTITHQQASLLASVFTDLSAKRQQQQQGDQALIQTEEMGAVHVLSDPVGSVKRLQRLVSVGEVTNVQLALQGGVSPVWDTVVHNYWSRLFVEWIRDKIAGSQ